MNCEIAITKKQAKTISSDELPVGAYFVVIGGQGKCIYQSIETSNPDQKRHISCATGAVSYANIQNVVRVYPKISVEVDY